MKSPAMVVANGVEHIGGQILVHGVTDFKAKTDCPLPTRDIIDGLRNARNMGLLKLKSGNGLTRIRRTGKRL